MTIQFMRNCVAMAAISLSMAAVHVSADCTDGANLGQDALKQFNVNIGSSENATLVKAYQNGQCTITQGVHGGGRFSASFFDIIDAAHNRTSLGAI